MPALNKRPPHPTFLPLPLKLKLATTPKIEWVLIRDFPEDKVFFKVFYRNLALLHLQVLLLPFVVLLQNTHTALAENVENLISAHLEWAPTLKVQKFNMRPGRLIE